MGLFSKLFGEVNRQVVRTATNEIVKNVQDKAYQAYGQPQQPSQPQPDTQYAQQGQYNNAPQPEGPSGFSWGPTMPAEDNQYSYQGSYIDYFMNIFRYEFPEYQINCQPSANMQYVLITFTRNYETALVVELLSKSSAVKKWRNNCKRTGTPYLRFYHNVEGWWNTRSYVITRTKNALNK